MCTKIKEFKLNPLAIPFEPNFEKDKIGGLQNDQIQRSSTSMDVKPADLYENTENETLSTNEKQCVTDYFVASNIGFHSN